VIFDPLPTHAVAVKAGWSRYYHAASTSFVAQPNQNNLGGSIYNWVDRNGGRKFQPGEKELRWAASADRSRRSIRT
jgi:hypothetical protein